MRDAKQDGGAAMVSRTIMLAELATVLDVLPQRASQADYRAAIVDDNVLAKRSTPPREGRRRDGSGSYMRLTRTCPCLPCFDGSGLLAQTLHPLLALPCSAPVPVPVTAASRNGRGSTATSCGRQL